MVTTRPAGISVSHESECPVVWVSGEHDIATKVSLTVAIARAAKCHAKHVVVDLSGVTFMDASTLGAIVRAKNRLTDVGGTLEVRAPAARALRILELAGLAGLLAAPVTS